MCHERDVSAVVARCARTWPTAIRRTGCWPGRSRLRLDAEIVRDVALAAAGLLTKTIGGPSVFPPQPEGVFDFTQDPQAVEGRRRRRPLSPRDVHALLAVAVRIRC